MTGSRPRWHGGARAILLIAVGLGALVVSGGTAGAPQPAVTPQVDEANLDRVREHVEHHRMELGIPGLAVGIVHDGEVVLLEGFGHSRAGGEPIRPDTPFLLASMSKPLTALAVMQHVEDGSVELDVPASTYLPELGPNGGAVSVRDLLQHRTGLSTYDGQRSMVDASGDDLADNVERLGPPLRADAPFQYSNANYDALALLVERVSGVTFETHMRERIFAPLGMRSSYVDAERAADAGLAQGHYRWLFLGYRPYDAPMPRGMVGSVTMFSSVEDLSRLLLAQLDGSIDDGTRIVSESALQAMREPAPYEAGSIGGYGLGWRVRPAFPPGAFGDDPPTDLTFVGHEGRWPTYNGSMWLVPEADLGFVMLANANDLADETVFAQIGRDVRAILFGLDPPGVSPGSRLLVRWSKHLALALVVGQLLLAVRTIPALSRSRRGALRRSDRIVVASATILDLTVIGAVLGVTRTAFEAPVRAALVLPDLRILLTAMGIGLVWGLLRTTLVGVGWIRRRDRGRPGGARASTASLP